MVKIFQIMHLFCKTLMQQCEEACMTNSDLIHPNVISRCQTKKITELDTEVNSSFCWLPRIPSLFFLLSFFQFHYSLKMAQDSLIFNLY